MSFIEKVWQTQHKLEERFKRIGRGQYGRVLRLARKPTSDEFIKSSWVVGIGIAIIGFIGFVVYYIWLKVPPIVADLLGI
jgi:protein transport protein SEC61 subunit gamma-like protein